MFATHIFIYFIRINGIFFLFFLFLVSSSLARSLFLFYSLRSILLCDAKERERVYDGLCRCGYCAPQIVVVDTKIWPDSVELGNVNALQNACYYEGLCVGL